MDFDWCLNQINMFLSNSGMYVGKWYMSDGMWKLNVMTIIKSNINKVSTSAYIF